MRGIREEEVFMRARCARRASQVFHTNIFLFKQLFLVFWNAVPVFPCCRGSDLCIPRVSRHSGHYTGHRTPPARPARGCSHLPTLAQARNKRLSTDAQHSDLKTFWVFLYSLLSLKLWTIKSVPQFGKKNLSLCSRRKVASCEGWGDLMAVLDSVSVSGHHHRDTETVSALVDSVDSVTRGRWWREEESRKNSAVVCFTVLWRQSVYGCSKRQHQRPAQPGLMIIEELGEAPLCS